MTCLLLRLLLRSSAAEWLVLVRKTVALTQVREVAYLAFTHPAIQGCIMDVCTTLCHNLIASLPEEGKDNALRQAFYCEHHLH